MDNRLWLKSYDEGVPHTMEYPEVPLYHFMEEAARKHPDSICTIFNGAAINYKEMNQNADSLAAGLAGQGIKKGDRVGLFAPNTPQYVVAFYALLKLGAIVVATNPLYTEREIIHQANDSGMEAMILMTNNYKKVKAIQDQTKIKKLIVTNLKEALPPIKRILFTLLREKKAGFRVDELAPGDVWMKDLIANNPPESRPQVDVSPDDTALFQYSGGTTGVPKAAIASHRGLVANITHFNAWIPKLVEGKEVVLLAIPLYHVYGIVAGMGVGVSLAASLVMVPDPRNTKDVLDNLQNHAATIYPGVPAMYVAINNNPDVIAGKYDLSSIKYCFSGSAALMRETKLKFEEFTGGNLIEAYGLSEMPTGSHCNPVLGENKVGSIGLPLPDVECRVVDLDDEVTDLPQGEIGELVMRGPHMMKGYHNMPTETKNTLRDGWLHTGDIVYMDEDGYFFIVDRKKDLIKPGGFQVWPREVEEVIMDFDKVLEVGVAGIPDVNSGEAVKAWVVLKPGQTATEDDIRAWCKERMAAYKVPKQVAFMDELPKSNVGKILRRELSKIDQE